MASQRTKHQRAGGNGAPGLQKSALEVGRYLRDGSRAVTQQAKAALAAAAEQVRDEAQRLFDHRKGKAAVRIDAVGDAAQRISHALHAVKADSIASYADAATDALQSAAR